MGVLEEYRDKVIDKLLTMLQSQMRRFLVKKNIARMLAQKRALTLLQKNLKAVLALRSWKWMHLWTNIQPLLQGAKKEEERLAREAEEKRLAEVARLEAEKAASEAAQRAAEAAQRAEAERQEQERQRAVELQRIREEQENAAKAIQNLKACVCSQLAILFMGVEKTFSEYTRRQQIKSKILTFLLKKKKLEY